MRIEWIHANELRFRNLQSSHDILRELAEDSPPFFMF